MIVHKTCNIHLYDYTLVFFISADGDSSVFHFSLDEEDVEKISIEDKRRLNLCCAHHARKAVYIPPLQPP